MTDIGIPSETKIQDYDQFRAADWQEKTVLFMGITKRHVDTNHGPATIAEISLVCVLDYEDGVRTFNDVWVFGAALAPTLYGSAQDVVVGVLGKGEAKAGKTAPWVLTDPTETNLVAARSWYSKFVVHTDDSTEYFYRPEDEAPF